MKREKEAIMNEFWWCIQKNKKKLVTFFFNSIQSTINFLSDIHHSLIHHTLTQNQPS